MIKRAGITNAGYRRETLKNKGYIQKDEILYDYILNLRYIKPYEKNDLYNHHRIAFSDIYIL